MDFWYLLARTYLLPVSLSIYGCVAAKPPLSKSRVTVLVMRHCIRSTPASGIHDIEGLGYYDNYSSQPWPEFGVPDYYCLPRGVDIIKGTGRWLRRHGNLPMPLQIVADDCARDNATAQALLAGLMPTQQKGFITSASPFHAAASCAKLSSYEIDKAISAQEKAIPMQDAIYSKVLSRLASVLQATGDAAAWNVSGCEFNAESGYLDGSCSAASDFVERFLMEWGGGMEVAWNRLDLKELPLLLKLHSWYRMIMDSTPELVARDQASIMVALAAALKKPADHPDVTRIFVGHDTQLNALSGALGLTWNPDPFPMNATLPDSLLRFESDGTAVTMSYVFPSNYSDEGDAMGSMTSVPATLVASGKSEILLRDLENLLEKGSVATCASNWTFDGHEHERFEDARYSSMLDVVV